MTVFRIFAFSILLVRPISLVADAQQPVSKSGIPPLSASSAKSAVNPSAQSEPKIGVPIRYQLPTAGPLPKTWRVTLAIVDGKNPDWIISQFASGVVRTVTKENGGSFTETWDGLDDNYMPVPPGNYAVKGIYMPAHEWAVDKEWHTVTPRFAAGASSWMPSPDEPFAPLPFGGDPVNAPLGDIAVGPNGVAVFYYSYLENGTNNPMFDLKKPVGYGQFLRAFNSGGAGGGTATATDGETVWSFCNEGGMKYVYRADGKAFGRSDGAARANSYLPKGWVTSMAAWHEGAKPFVAIAQRGKIVQTANKRGYVESTADAVDLITLHDGENGAVLAELPLARPQSVTVSHGVLYALHAEGAGFAVSSIKVGAGVAEGKWAKIFTVPPAIKPFDMKVDSHGRFYVSDEASNHVFQLDATGKMLLTYGSLEAQKPGAYDPLTLMAPGKLATWLDPEGHDRLLIVENAGPNRVAEWGADGKLIRETLTLQTKANDGYGVDPEHPEMIYVPGQKGWLTRFRVDYAKGAWKVDAVWPLAEDPRAPGLKKPRFIRGSNGRSYLACAGGAREGTFNVYRLGRNGEGWKLSAAIIRVADKDKKVPPKYFLWHDANGNGRVDDDEMVADRIAGQSFHLPGAKLEHGFRLSRHEPRRPGRVATCSERLRCHSAILFSKLGKRSSPIPVFVARAEGKADAVHGGNELAEEYVSDWMQTDGTKEEGYYVNARGGKNFSANEGPQHKISRYIPDGRGGYQLNGAPGAPPCNGTRVRGKSTALCAFASRSMACSASLTNPAAECCFTPRMACMWTPCSPMARSSIPGTPGSMRCPANSLSAISLAIRRVAKSTSRWARTRRFYSRRKAGRSRKIPCSRSPPCSRSVIHLRIADRVAAGDRSQRARRRRRGEVRPFHPRAWRGRVRWLPQWVGIQPAGEVSIGQRPDRGSALPLSARSASPPLARAPRRRNSSRMPLPPIARIFTHDQLSDTLSFYIQGDVNAKPGPAGGPAGRCALRLRHFQRRRRS